MVFLLPLLHSLISVIRASLVRALMLLTQSLQIRVWCCDAPGRELRAATAVWRQLPSRHSCTRASALHHVSASGLCQWIALCFCCSVGGVHCSYRLNHCLVREQAVRESTIIAPSPVRSPVHTVDVTRQVEKDERHEGTERQRYPEKVPARLYSNEKMRTLMIVDLVRE